MIDSILINAAQVATIAPTNNVAVSMEKLHQATSMRRSDGEGGAVSLGNAVGA